MNLEQIVNRRTEELSASTRSEILMSIGAALLFAGRSGLAIRAVSRSSSRDWIRRRPRLGRDLVVLVSPPDLAADPLARTRSRPPASEYYRKELERRRDHLRNPWLWHGPLFLACAVLCDPGRGNVSGLPGSAQRTASGRPARGLDGIRRLAPPPSGQGTSAGDRRNVAYGIKIEIAQEDWRRATCFWTGWTLRHRAPRFTGCAAGGRSGCPAALSFGEDAQAWHTSPPPPPSRAPYWAI